MKLCPECFSEYEDQVNECPTDLAVLSAIEPDPLVGSKVSDRYEVLSVIGRGGMGVVYKARHENMDRLVALKMLHSYLVSDAEALKRFHREAKAVSRVKHPHTVTLYDFGISSSGQPYIVMDFIEGCSLKKIIKEDGPLPFDRVEHIFMQVIEALTCAHAEGIVHRDLKPENIMLTKRANDPEWVEVVDFGISKLKSKETQQTYNITRVGDVCGSPPYMSPEQCLASLPIDSRSDVYSLAIVLYEAIAGRLPFKAKTAIEMIDSHLYATPTPLKAANPDLACCDALNNLLSKALQKEPDNRQQTMEELGKELKEAIKRDSLRLNSFRMRASEMLSREAELLESGGHQGGVVGLSDLARDELALENGADGAPREGWVSRVINAVLYVLGKRSRLPSFGADYAFANCPFCSTPVEPGIRFCLDCGRNLASSQELTKLRAIQGKFAYPKSHKSEHGAIEFSNRAKRSMSKSGYFMGIPPFILVINLVLILALCVLYFAQEGDIPGLGNKQISQKQSGKKAGTTANAKKKRSE